MGGVAGNVGFMGPAQNEFGFMGPSLPTAMGPSQMKLIHNFTVTVSGKVVK